MSANRERDGLKPVAPMPKQVVSAESDVAILEKIDVSRPTAAAPKPLSLVARAWTIVAAAVFVWAVALVTIGLLR